MPLYRYKASDSQSREQHGETTARNPDELRKILSSRGLTLLQIQEQEPGTPPGLGPRDAAELTHQLAGLTKSGLTLPEGLRALSAELESRPLRRVLALLATEIEAGESLEKALEKWGSSFPASLRGIVKAASQSGRMAEVLGESARLQRVSIELRRRIWLGLSYPLGLFLVFLAVFVAISVFVINDFENIYRDFGVSLPIMTMALIRFAEFLRDSGWILLAGLGGVWLLMTLGGLFMGSRARSRLIARIPLIGSVWRSASLAEFCHLLALLLEADLPLPEALPLAGDATRDDELAWASRWAAAEVDRGRSFPDSISHTRVFPQGLARLISWAEKGQSLPESLHVAGELFEARARPHAAAAVAVFTAIIVYLVLMGIAFMLTALYLPLVKLISELSG